MANTYKNTMNLPQTDFPMRGNLPASEPKRLEKWEQEHIYEQVLEKNKDGKPSSCTMARLMPTAPSTSATPSTRC